MVLQREQSLPVWGWATPGATVTVELAGHRAQGTAAADGKWQVSLPALQAGGPHTLTAQTSGAEPVVVTDIMVGEVWLCSGQSNMEFMLSGVKNSQAALAGANQPLIRLFQVPKIASYDPATDVSAQWAVCTPESASTFSAVGYFHALELQRRLGVSVGLINASWGGTIAEAWTSREGLAAEPMFASIISDCDRLLTCDKKEWDELRSKYAEWDETYMKHHVPRNLGLEQGWEKPDASSEGWVPFKVPGYWQRAGFNFSGVLWFRREVMIPNEWAGKDLTLSIGACDKSEWTYFNGEPVGSFTIDDNPNAWSMPRTYTVPGRLVKAGRNVLAVRVFSNIYDGGMSGPTHLMFVKSATAPDAESIPLHGTWSARVEHDFGIVPPPPPLPPSADNPHVPWTLFGGMIAPLVPYAMRGAIWYQGESNESRTLQYRTLFPALIRDWRKHWGQEHFHFYFVQLANFRILLDHPDESRWAEIREAQRLALALPDTGMAVIIDVGEGEDIHPTNKQDVGLRLALNALSKIHGLKEVTPCGPLYKSSQVEGAQMRIHFDLFGSPLEVRGGSLKGFAIAGADRKFVWGDARIDGDTLVVSSPEVPAPVAVRYAWADNPPCTLYNRAGLPASPFRTDDWPA